MPTALNPCRLLKAISLAVILALAPCGAFAINSLTVLADTSMGPAMAMIVRDYSRDHTVAVNASFATPAAQAAQISEGGSADILITTNLPWIEQLKTQGLIDIHSQTLVAHNTLALVGPAGSTLSLRMTPGMEVSPLVKALGGEPGFVVGNPETLPVGVSGKEALRNLGIAGDLEPYTLYVKDSAQMEDMVVRQHDYGLFFASSAVGTPGMKVIALVPESSYQPVAYYAVVIAGENMDEARKFLGYLKSPASKKLLNDNGFTTN